MTQQKTRTIVLIGAGSASFTRGLIADMIVEGGPWDLRLVDIDEDNLAVARGLAEKMIEAKRAPIKLSAGVDRTALLPGAEFVVTTIAVGGRRAWENDVFIPRKYGVDQPVGDTIMPGGIFRALRMIPPLVDIARDIARLAPDARFFNYSNPMAMNCRAIRKATGVPVVGLCHGVIMVARFLANLAEADERDCTYTPVGMNHLTWFIRFDVKGKDALPAINARLKKLVSEAEAAGGYYGNVFSAELLDIFGAFPAVLDRHVAEFLPQFLGGEPYFRNLGTGRFAFEKTIEHGDRTFEEMRREALGEKAVDEAIFQRAAGEHEQLISIIRALDGAEPVVFSVNIPNTGQVTNLPPDLVLECPAAISRQGIEPVPVGVIPTGCRATVEKALQVAELAVEAALERDHHKLCQALVMDGSVDSVRKIQRMAEEMLEAHREYLDGW